MIDLSGLKSRAGTQVRREQYGSMGQQKLNESYPRQPPQQVVTKVMQDMFREPLCNRSAAAYAVTAPDVKQRLEQLQVPKDQQCLTATAIQFQKVLETGKARDRRFNDSHINLDRTARAKKHLDRARQLYWFSVGLMRKGIDTLRVAEHAADVPTRNRLTKQGRASLSRAKHLVYNMTAPNSQQVRQDKKCALGELYEGYRLLREYEMNPLPPLLPNGLPNPARIEEDTTYNLLMGTYRMTPNRLGIGLEAQQVWHQYGYTDPNTYTPSLAIAASQGARLYGNIDPTAANGAIQWSAYHDFIKARYGTATVPRSVAAARPTPEALAQQGFQPHTVRTDTSRAMQNIHQFFPPPAALAGIVRNLGANPRAPPNPLPVGLLPYRTPTAQTPFYPTGPPELGVPPQQNDGGGGYWDARVACNMLHSTKGGHAADEMAAMAYA